MTREQMAAKIADMTHAVSDCTPYGRGTVHECPLYRDTLALLSSQSCATCQHADIDDTIEGWCFCAAPAGDDQRFPFRGLAMPLDERCKGWTAKQDA